MDMRHHNRTESRPTHSMHSPAQCDAAKRSRSPSNTASRIRHLSPPAPTNRTSQSLHRGRHDLQAGRAGNPRARGDHKIPHRALRSGADDQSTLKPSSYWSRSTALAPRPETRYLSVGGLAQQRSTGLGFGDEECSCRAGGSAPLVAEREARDRRAEPAKCLGTQLPWMSCQSRPRGGREGDCSHAKATRAVQAGRPESRGARSVRSAPQSFDVTAIAASISQQLASALGDMSGMFAVCGLWWTVTGDKTVPAAERLCPRPCTGSGTAVRRRLGTSLQGPWFARQPRRRASPRPRARTARRASLAVPSWRAKAGRAAPFGWEQKRGPRGSTQATVLRFRESGRLGSPDQSDQIPQTRRRFGQNGRFCVPNFRE